MLPRDGSSCGDDAYVILVTGCGTTDGDVPGRDLGAPGCGTANRARQVVRWWIGSWR
jgi:hypothetical protein